IPSQVKKAVTLSGRLAGFFPSGTQIMDIVLTNCTRPGPAGSPFQSPHRSAWNCSVAARPKTLVSELRPSPRLFQSDTVQQTQVRVAPCGLGGSTTAPLVGLISLGNSSTPRCMTGNGSLEF
ncbi:MAG: hypothetical protein M0Z96_02190, partial [Actinomycetota bacterium]|nr:hypothetical protein [Actinomycetota bacterium]